MNARTRLRLALLDLLDEPILPLTLGAVVVLFAGRWTAGALSMGAASRGQLDFVLWWSWAFVGTLACWMGSRVLGLPLATRSARWLLAGPLSPIRWAVERLAVAFALQAGVVGVLVLAVAVHHGVLAAWGWTLLLEALLLTLLSGVLGVLFRPATALALGLANWWIGHLVGPWASVLAAQGHPVAAMMVGVLPDADVLDVHSRLLAGHPVSLQLLGTATLWTGAWIVAISGGLVALLARRDL